MSSGKPFTIKPELVDTHLVTNTAVLSLAELMQPSCPSCFKPGRLAGYCQRCTTSGAATLHANHPHRGVTA